MRVSIAHAAPLLAVLALATPSDAGTLTPAVTTPTSKTSPTAVTSPTNTSPSSPAFAPSPRPTARWTPPPSASPARAPTVVPTPDEISGVQGDEPAAGEVPSAPALPTSPPVGEVRAFRTPERGEPPAFVAPRAEPPSSPDQAHADEPTTESTVPPDRPYVATVTFRAVAGTDIDGFELFVIYPRSAGTFVGEGAAVDCRKTGDATMFADDQGGGTFRLLVASNHPLTFPFDVACHFTVEPNAALTSRLIAVNVAEVTSGGQAVDPSMLTISVSAH